MEMTRQKWRGKGACELNGIEMASELEHTGIQVSSLGTLGARGTR